MPQTKSLSARSGHQLKSRRVHQLVLKGFKCCMFTTGARGAFTPCKGIFTQNMRRLDTPAVEWNVGSGAAKRARALLSKLMDAVTKARERFHRKQYSLANGLLSRAKEIAQPFKEDAELSRCPEAQKAAFAIATWVGRQLSDEEQLLLQEKAPTTKEEARVSPPLSPKTRKQITSTVPPKTRKSIMPPVPPVPPPSAPPKTRRSITPPVPPATKERKTGFSLFSSAAEDDMQPAEFRAFDTWTSPVIFA